MEEFRNIAQAVGRVIVPGKSKPNETRTVRDVKSNKIFLHLRQQ